MQLHQLKPIHKKQKEKRVGRGGKKGTYSGKGVKGQKSRAGRKLEPPIRGIIKRYHKLKGYNFNAFKEKATVVGLAVLNEKFNAGDIVSPKSLIEKKIIKKSSGKIPEIKILKNGTLDKSLAVTGCFVSGTAKKEIEKAGGTVKDKE